MRRLFKFSVAVFGLVVVGLLLSFMVWVSSLVPGWLSGAAFAVLGVFVLWFILRGRNSGVAGSEYSFLGRSGSKDGLL